MKHEMREKIDLFRASKLLLAGIDVQAGPDDAERMRGLAASLGVSVSSIRDGHSRMVAEIGEKLAGLDTENRIVILDRGRDLETPETLLQAFSGIFGEGAFLELAREHIGALFEAGRAGFCLPILEEKTAVVYPENLAGPDFDGILMGIPAPMRKDLPSFSAMNRLMLYHEALGHGTETGEEITGMLRANRELRADIAAIAGYMRDTGDAHAPAALIALRELSPLRAVHAAFGCGQWLSETPSIWANAPILREVVVLIGEKGPAFRNLDDAALFAFVKDTFEKLRISREEFIHRDQALLDAYVITEEATRGRTDKRDALAQNAPRCLADALAHINAAADALCFLCEVEPQQMRNSPARHSALPVPEPKP